MVAVCEISNTRARVTRLALLGTTRGCMRASFRSAEHGPARMQPTYASWQRRAAPLRQRACMHGPPRTKHGHRPAQMITQALLRASPHLDAAVFEAVELQACLDGQEERRGKTLCASFCVLLERGGPWTGTDMSGDAAGTCTTSCSSHACATGCCSTCTARRRAQRPRPPARPTARLRACRSRR